jgi:ribosomal small subunit protein bTHX
VFTLRADTLHATSHGDSVMGKGDKRTKRGKIFRGSYGKTRLHKKGGKSKTAKKQGS